jgi:hypothetical protein
MGFAAGGDVGGIITFRSVMKAIMTGEPIDWAIPGTLAYNGTIGAKAVQMALTIGLFTPVCVSCSSRNSRPKSARSTTWTGPRRLPPWA